MFAEKFDALMNIAEVTNSQLGRGVSINPSHIGRLRSGARPLPRKHEYLGTMCRYLAGHIRKDYQIDALRKLTGIGSASLASAEGMALYLEQWLPEQGQENAAAFGRLVSGSSRLPSGKAGLPGEAKAQEAPQKAAAYLYGNAGKRKAVEQFFAAVLQEDKPRTLLLFSDENMAWLYEDAAFAAKWAGLFRKALLKGNRVKIIHNVSRDMNEMLEAVTRWIPIYMTGMIEPYCYPRIRDGIFRRTLFLAPDTAAVVSSSVQQATDGMLNLFLTDRAALGALTAEYDHYLSLCRPLMRILTPRDADILRKTAENFYSAEGNAFLCAAMPPLFAMPEEMVRELSERPGNGALTEQWKRSLSAFRKNIKKNRLKLVLQDPQKVLSGPEALLSPEALHPCAGSFCSDAACTYTKEQYLLHMGLLRKMEEEFENLEVCFVRRSVDDHTCLFVKEDTGVIMVRSGEPRTAFVISERNMVSAFWDYVEKCMLA